MEAWLKAQALWRIVNGTSKRPSLEGENADTKPLDEWDAKSDKAAGWIWLTLEPDQKALVSSCKDSPITMWTTLQSTSRRRLVVFEQQVQRTGVQQSGN